MHTMKYCMFFTLILFFSCRDLVQEEFEDFPKIPVINSILVTNDNLHLDISLTGKIDTTKLQKVNDAEVSLFVNNVFKEKVKHSSDGMYLSQTKINAGNKYTCEIKIQGQDLIIVSDSIIAPCKLLNIKHIKYAGKTEEGENYPAIEFAFTNNPNERIYYEVLIKLFVYDEIQNANIIFIEDPLILKEGLPIAVFSNELINGNQYTMRLNYSTGYSNGKEMELFPFVLEIRTLSNDYYRFVKQLYLYELSRYPDGFNGTSAAFSVYSNIPNAYGIFAGYSKSFSDTIVPE